MAFVPWIMIGEKSVGRGHPTLADVDNRPLRSFMTSIGLDPDADVPATALGATTVLAAGTTTPRSLASRFAEVFNCNDFGASTSASGAVNRAAFLAAFNAAKAAGGGRITAAPGTYQITGYSTQSLPVPVNGPDYTTVAENLSANFYLLEPTGLHFDMPGVTLQATESGFEMFLLNGPRDCTFNIGRIVTPTVNTAGTITTPGLNAIAVTCTTRDGWGLHIPFLHADHCNVALYVFGDAAGSYRMRGIRVGTIYHETGTYGVALHNNGDDTVIESLVTNEVGRPLFAYGVDGVKANIHNRAQLGGLHLLLKAYDRDLRNIDLRYRIVTGNASVPGLALESEHHPATQPTPGVLRNIRVWYDDEGSFGGNKGIQFDYKQDGVSTPTCATTLFDGIELAGNMDNSGLASLVLQSPLGSLSTERLFKSGAPVSNTIYSTGGFFTVVGGCASIPGPDKGDHRQATSESGTTQYGSVEDYRASSAATSLIVGKYLRTGTVAAAFTNALMHVLRIANPVKGAGSTITKAVGLFFEALTVGATNFAFETVDPFIVNGAHVRAGTGSPEAVVTAPVGSLFLRTDGGAGTSMYIKESGTGNTGWVAK